MKFLPGSPIRFRVNPPTPRIVISFRNPSQSTEEASFVSGGKNNRRRFNSPDFLPVRGRSAVFISPFPLRFIQPIRCWPISRILEPGFIPPSSRTGVSVLEEQVPRPSRAKRRRISVAGETATVPSFPGQRRARFASSLSPPSAGFLARIPLENSNLSNFSSNIICSLGHCPRRVCTWLAPLSLSGGRRGSRFDERVMTNSGRYRFWCE